MQSLSLSLLVFAMAPLVSSLASAGVLMSEAPNFFNGSPSTTLTHLTLEKACGTILLPERMVPCNPAFLDLRKDSENAERTAFDGNFYLGDDYSKLSEYSNFLQGGDKSQLVENFLNEKDPISMQASAALWFTYDWFSATFVPYKVTYFSVVRDQANPHVAIHAMQERTLSTQVGGELWDNFRGGLQLRGVDRKFVHEEFSIFDAVADPDGVLQVKDQKVLYVEPGVGYYVPVEWKPHVSLFMANWGFADRKYDDTVPEASPTPLFDLGVGISPPIRWGDIDVGVVYETLPWQTDSSYQALKSDDHLRLGALYKLGLLNAALGWDASNLSVGVFSGGVATRKTSEGFPKFGVGIMYMRNKILNADNGDYIYHHAVFTEFNVLL